MSSYHGIPSPRRYPELIWHCENHKMMENDPLTRTFNCIHLWLYFHYQKTEIARNVHLGATIAHSWLLRTKDCNVWLYTSNQYIDVFLNDYSCNYIIQAQHNCLSRMNPNVMLSVTKLIGCRSFICHYILDWPCICGWLSRKFLSIYLPTIIIAIIWYIPNMTVPHKWTKSCWLASPN